MGNRREHRPDERGPGAACVVAPVDHPRRRRGVLSVARGAGSEGVAARYVRLGRGEVAGLLEREG